MTIHPIICPIHGPPRFDGGPIILPPLGAFMPDLGKRPAIRVSSRRAGKSVVVPIRLADKYDDKPELVRRGHQLEVEYGVSYQVTAVFDTLLVKPPTAVIPVCPCHFHLAPIHSVYSQ